LGVQLAARFGQIEHPKAIKRKLRILMLEDETRDADLVRHTLKEGGFDFAFRRVETESEFVRELKEFQPNVILSDHGLPQFDGFTALSIAKARSPDVPFIFVTGSLGEEMAIKALKSGAADFVLKHHLTTLPPALHRALRQVEFRVQRRRAEEALQSSEERYRSLVELSPDALFVQGDGKIVFINSAGVRLFGATAAADLIGRFTLELVHPEDRRAIDRTIRESMEEHRPVPFAEARIVRRDGEVIDVEIAAAPMTFERKNAAQVIVHNVADRKQAEEQIRRLNAELEQRVVDRTAALEAANKELEAFSYSVSHDLRAPLRHIEGFVEILRGTKAGELDSESQQYLQTISDAARQMGRLIDDLLAFSRTARAELRKTRISLNEIVRDVLREVRSDVANRDVEWIIGVLPQAEGDANLLRQVLSNLVENALKYTRPRKVARIEIGSNPNDDEIIVFVKDNGVGFDMRYAHKLFGVFQRLHSATDFEGTGVGLANVRRIIHRHGGRTWAEAKLDEGATFYFSLPKNCGENPARESES
jgi:PAS domain S-box-containing protein